MSRLFVAAYTNLAVFENCPRKYHHMYVLKDLPRTETPEMAWGNAVHDALDQRLRPAKVLLPKNMVQFERWPRMIEATGYPQTTEQRLGIRADGTPCEAGVDWNGDPDPGGFAAKDVWLRGKIDVQMRLSVDRMLILDWKTGKPREDPFELQVSALLAQAHTRGAVKIFAGHYIWLKFDEAGPTHNLSDTKRTFDRVAGLVDAVKRSDWRPKKNPLCGWCPVTSCEFNTVEQRKRAGK